MIVSTLSENKIIVSISKKKEEKQRDGSLLRLVFAEDACFLLEPL